ncbi:hypothetical protein [Achromobacter sp. KK8]
MRFYSQVLGIAFDGIVDLHDSRMAYFPFEEGTDGASGALAQGPAYLAHPARPHRLFRSERSRRRIAPGPGARQRSAVSQDPDRIRLAGGRNPR